MVLLESSKGEINSNIIDFSLKGIDDKSYDIHSFDNKKILIIIFMCNHCPYVKAIIKRLVDLQDYYSSKSVQLIGINPNDSNTYPEDSFDNMKIFAAERGINFPYLTDEDQTTAKNYDAVCTPDIYVFDEHRKLRYRGRLDDNWKDETNVKTSDLRTAVELLLEGKEIEFPQIPSMGCSIKWKN